MALRTSTHWQGMTGSQAILFAAIMAAGSSSRFGATKQVATLSGAPLVRRAATTARQVCRNNVLTVIGHDMVPVLKALGSDAGFVVVNERHEKGLGSSIASAARTCCRDADALLLLLADQPLITADHLQTLIDSWSGSPDEIVATAFDGIEGPPVLFPSGTFDELCALTGDEGARSLFRKDCFRLKTVGFEPAAVDIDTPADLAAIS